jgi:hypothetical protein
MKSNRIALAAALILAMAAPAVAGTTAGLVAAGNTLAGPGAASVALNATQTVYTDAAANSDVCTTVVNAGGPIRLSMVDDGPSTVSIDLASGASGALCRDAMTRVDLVCLGGSGCNAQWRVDRY